MARAGRKKKTIVLWFYPLTGAIMGPHAAYRHSLYRRGQLVDTGPIVLASEALQHSIINAVVKLDREKGGIRAGDAARHMGDFLRTLEARLKAKDDAGLVLARCARAPCYVTAATVAEIMYPARGAKHRHTVATLLALLDPVESYWTAVATHDIHGLDPTIAGLAAALWKPTVHVIPPPTGRDALATAAHYVAFARLHGARLPRPCTLAKIAEDIDAASKTTDPIPWADAEDLVEAAAPKTAAANAKYKTKGVTVADALAAYAAAKHGLALATGDKALAAYAAALGVPIVYVYADLGTDPVKNMKGDYLQLAKDTKTIECNDYIIELKVVPNTPRPKYI